MELLPYSMCMKEPKKINSFFILLEEAFVDKLHFQLLFKVVTKEVKLSLEALHIGLIFQMIKWELKTEGLISLNQPLYKNWTKVLFAYCDGSLLQGGNDSPIKYKDATLYFRGGRIMRSHFKWLTTTYQLDKASKIMFTGGSAGGLAPIIWSNYLQTIVQNPDSVYVIPDSAIFVNSTTFKTNIPLIQQQISTLMQIAHVSEKTPLSQCNGNNPGQEWKCLFIEENYKYLKGRFMFINSQYDEWAISNILQIHCLQKGSSGYTPKNCPTEQMTAIQDYRTRYLKFINEELNAVRRWGMWSIACSQHVYQVYKTMYDSELERVPMKTGLTVKDAIQNFVLNHQVQWTYDQTSWPGNSQCAY